MDTEGFIGWKSTSGANVFHGRAPLIVVFDIKMSDRR